MAVAQIQLDRMQNRQLARFERMGLAVRPMPDGLSLLVSLPLGGEPMESVSGPMLPRRVVFSTVGANQIKCLRPRAFFGLPLIDVRHCPDAASIETTIRQAWRERTNELRDSRSTLHDIGLSVESIAEGSALAFPMAGEMPNVRVVMQRLGEAILPSTGPLTGLPLEQPGDRILEVSDCLDSAAGLECKLEQRIHELNERRREGGDSERIRNQIEATPDLGPPPKRSARASSHRPKILIVGSRLVDDDPLREELERQGFRVTSSRSEPQALARLASMSPDVVISEYALGRSDGASLVQAMCGLAGIERIPVVLLDDSRHENRREVARAVGAAGYLSTPVDTERFVSRLGRLIEEPGNRRFTRYQQRLAARFEGAAQGCLVTELGRGGVFVATPQVLESQTAMRCKIALPEIGRALLFEGEVRYCTESQGAVRNGIGLRFFDMSPADETLLIEYLGLLESKT
jgi:two-component system, chemotaxis family, chemotaxis protein CheY